MILIILLDFPYLNKQLLKIQLHLYLENYKLKRNDMQQNII